MLLELSVREKLGEAVIDGLLFEDFDISGDKVGSSLVRVKLGLCEGGPVEAESVGAAGLVVTRSDTVNVFELLGTTETVNETVLETKDGVGEAVKAGTV